MRLASFFIISLALHSGALLLPISFHGWHHERAIVVSILPMASLTSSGGGSGDGVRQRKPKAAAPSPAPRANTTDQAVATTPNVQERPSVMDTVEKINEFHVTLPTPPTPAARATARGEVAAPGGGFARASGSASGSASGKDVGGTADGLGRGDGLRAGDEQGSSAVPVVITRPRYSDTPKPVYPEDARRQGREGRVLLRVLIDVQGKTKTVEIQRSSGSDILDQAAAEALQGWRFHPARAGNQPIEDWATIPIEFRLTDLQN